MKVTRKIIKIDEELCDGCGSCIPSCAEGALEIVDGKAKIIKDLYCDGLGACLGECPMGALTLETRECDEFDEAAVEELLAAKAKEGAPSQPAGCPSSKLEGFAMADTQPCGCPSSNVVSFGNPAPGVRISTAGGAGSALTHWPVQIRLIPANAPFLKNSDLLIAADCAAVAYAGLHTELLEGRTVMMGCPKFDDLDSYVEKFVDVFRTAGIRSVTVALMEVPCCTGLIKAVEKALELSGMDIPLEEVVISTRGEAGPRKELI
jgi:Pyruvate/2-oxoacid:ferredoxin oxidoreductase delta subunit